MHIYSGHLPDTTIQILLLKVYAAIRTTDSHACQSVTHRYAPCHGDKDCGFRASKVNVGLDNARFRCLLHSENGPPSEQVAKRSNKFGQHFGAVLNGLG